VAVTELHRLERLARRHFKKSKIGFRVAADNFGLQCGAIVEDDIDLISIRDDMVVGHHQTRGIDNETGAERIDAPRRGRRAVLPIRSVFSRSVLTILSALSALSTTVFEE